MISDLDLPSDVSEVPHVNGNQTRLEYNLAWSRTYLKNLGMIDNSSRAVWSLTALGRNTDVVDDGDYPRAARRSERQTESDRGFQGSYSGDFGKDHSDESESWRETLANTLQSIPPEAFERLSMRLLRESGFIEVEVTGRPRDGGIDGNGIIRIAGLISFPVLFQCKRYSGSVGASAVRDFRGAMVGRADKGLILTTGSFTREAHREATRDGAPPIDLIDGELLIDRLKDLGLGVRTKMVEVVEIDKGWFETI